ncbi:C13 family peptidase [Sphingomonas sp. TDK1]|uniref:C13 family peptidase n=1 Tax=Sphingomonas sp. TDK1 TaxID=453247 RepID=UPI0007D9F91D|nr:C13 family peptidase [Sphingomonas sp. TDK1]OAN66150.1 peptidase C13 [Sphingomonas sp. TDK1]
MRFWLRASAVMLALSGSASAFAQQQPPEHRSEWPGLVSGDDGIDGMESGPELQRGREPGAMLADQRRLSAALAGLQPERKGVVDAYVLSVALDSDPVFSREARESGRVLTRRFDADGRTLVLAGPDGRGGAPLPAGSLTSLTLALARVAELMDHRQDVLVLYVTAHGAPDAGIAYHDGDQGFGVLPPKRLAELLDGLGIRNRLLLISACYSGAFVKRLMSDTTAILTAASATRSSFGCRAENDWTFFGDALVNHALRKPQPLADAAAEARKTIIGWEREGRLDPSMPQVTIGDAVGSWLAPLEARMPKQATAPVGAPATDALQP